MKTDIDTHYHCEVCGKTNELGKPLNLDLGNLLTCDTCAGVDERPIFDAPTASQLIETVSDMIHKVYAVGLKKHGEHKWYYGETVRHHVDRSIRHAATAMMRRDGNESVDVDGEDAADHLERSIIRGLFALVKIRDGHE